MPQSLQLCVLQRLPWESAIFHVASAKSVQQLTLIAARNEPLGHVYWPLDSEWLLCKQWMGSDKFNGKVAVSLLYFVLQLTFIERSLIQPSLAALVDA